MTPDNHAAPIIAQRAVCAHSSSLSNGPILTRHTPRQEAVRANQCSFAGVQRIFFPTISAILLASTTLASRHMAHRPRSHQTYCRQDESLERGNDAHMCREVPIRSRSSRRRNDDDNCNSTNQYQLDNSTECMMSDTRRRMRRNRTTKRMESRSDNGN